MDGGWVGWVGKGGAPNQCAWQAQWHIEKMGCKAPRTSPQLMLWRFKSLMDSSRASNSEQPPTAARAWALPPSVELAVALAFTSALLLQRATPVA